MNLWASKNIRSPFSRYQRIILCCCLSFLMNIVYAQDYEISLDSFSLSGATIITGDECFRLTPDEQWSAGSIWYNTSIDLRSSFHMNIKVRFGCKDENGADGMVFAFTTNKNITGYAGEGMGFASLRPSLGIEVDTWRNDHLGDPVHDHVAILHHGLIHHSLSLAGPINISNIEDCLSHDFSIVWDSYSKQLSVHLDQRQIIAYKIDLVHDIFEGKYEVYWGMTAATGAYNNTHEVCIQKLTKSIPLEQLEFNQTYLSRLLSGEKLILQNQKFESGSSSLTAESLPDINRLVNLLKKHPEKSITIMGYTDNSGKADENEILSFKRANSVALYLKWKGISAKRIKIMGLGDRDPIGDNTTSTGRAKNRRIEIYLSIPRT